MTTEERLIAIAKSRGWKPVSLGPDLPLAWEKGDKKAINSCYLPRYLTDLNEMHEIETDMSREEFCEYIIHLKAVISRDTGNGASERDVISAKAYQRAEAYARIIQ